MEKNQIEKLLDDLYSIEDSIKNSLDMKERQIRSRIPREVAEDVESIERMYNEKITHLQEAANGIEKQIREMVLESKETVKGREYSAQYKKGSVSYDAKGLDGLAVAFPQIKSFRKEGKPSVAIIRSKKNASD